MKLKIETAVARRDSHNIEEIFHFGIPHDPFADVTMARGSKYVHPSYEGEAILTLGGSDFFADYVQGIINAMPFNCMPGVVVTSKTNEIKKNNNDIPFFESAL